MKTYKTKEKVTLFYALQENVAIIFSFSFGYKQNQSHALINHPIR